MSGLFISWVAFVSNFYEMLLKISKFNSMVNKKKNKLNKIIKEKNWQKTSKN